jgi:3-methylfumaryl-CoA hydratase
MQITPRSFSTVQVGDDVGLVTHTITRVTLFLFGVAYFTAHRIHYDVEYSRSEGFDDVLVTANLLSAYSANLIEQWARHPGALRSLEERNLAPASAGDTVVLTGTVVDLEPTPTGGTVLCNLRVDNDRGLALVTGQASIALPD